jgi:hypothetical protein
MSPKDNIFPSKNDILQILDNIQINEDDTVIEDVSLDDLASSGEMEQLELLTDDDDDDTSSGEMEQLELLTDDDDDVSELYHLLHCFENIDMEFDNIETPPSRSSNGLVFSGEFSCRRQLFYCETTTSSDESD